jgi:hypothetical protein
MPGQILILTVELDGNDGLIVTFSDGTTSAYVVEELLELRPKREPTEAPTAPKADLLNGGETAGRIEWRQTMLRLNMGV